ncbi:MAG: Na+/H+ antiporter NhaA [Actinobacteria bacterium]|nr:Na+/H+ antiporter NhaA [Actinomycetota bacterium]
MLRPLQEFLSSSTAGATVLLAAAAVALIWANSPFRASYTELWGTDLVVGVGRWAIREDLRRWVNDGLMTLFFLLAGLEIKRELTSGELRDRRAAVLPVLAAIGGMAVPALLYLGANAGYPGAKGWGMSMPTDLALVLGVLALASPRVPTSLKAFVVSLAITDDVGTIVAVLVAYARGADVAWAVVAIGVVITVVLIRRIHVRWTPAYVVLGAALWLAMRAAGLNPTLSGVVIGLLAPAEPFQRPGVVSSEATRIAAETADDPSPPDADVWLWLRLAWLSNESVSPLARAEHVLLPWVSFVVLPMFALANGGVELSTAPLSDPAGVRVAVGLTLARLVGKVVGIVGVSWIAVRIGIGRLPSGVRWPHLAGTAAVAGIGFTVSLFVSELAFGGTPLSDAARMGVLLSSVTSGVVGLLMLRSIRDPVDRTSLADDA